MRIAFDLFYNIFSWLLIFRVILSFISVDQSSPGVKLLYQLTEPVLAPIRNAFGLLQVGSIALDVAPIVVLILLDVLRRLIFLVV
jgi:YggT family protein